MTDLLVTPIVKHYVTDLIMRYPDACAMLHDITEIALFVQIIHLVEIDILLVRIVSKRSKFVGASNDCAILQVNTDSSRTKLHRIVPGRWCSAYIVHTNSFQRLVDSLLLDEPGSRKAS